MNINPPRVTPPTNTPKVVPIATVVFGGILLALVSFSAGMQAESNNLFSNTLLTTNTNEGTLPEDLDYSSVEDVYDALRENFAGTLSEQELLDGLKSGLVEASGDEYTVYLNEEQAKQFDSDLNGTFSGIGAELGLEDERLVIIAPLDGYPAQKAGLRSGDILLEIDGEDATNLSVEDAVLKIRGETGTDVTLTIQRGDEQEKITITRQEITVPSVEYEILEDNIGYLRVSRFADDTSRLAREAAEEFQAQNVDGVILDLRNNSGGFLNSAVDVSGLWLENEVIVDQRTDNGETVTDTLKSGDNAPLKGMQTAVLINGGSASASEIVAGALQDYEVATLIGETTFGKGSVQILEPLSSGGVLKVTVARWYTPNGNNIDDQGISPDVAVEFNEQAFQDDNSLDNQKKRAIEFLKNDE